MGFQFFNFFFAFKVFKLHNEMVGRSGYNTAKGVWLPSMQARCTATILCVCPRTVQTNNHIATRPQNVWHVGPCPDKSITSFRGQNSYVMARRPVWSHDVDTRNFMASTSLSNNHARPKGKKYFAIHLGG